jgi:hypothetical protein
MLGKPGEGFHSVRLFGFAILDVVGTFFLGYLLHRFTGLKYYISTIIMFLIGIFLHWLFCVDTKLNMMLGL